MDFQSIALPPELQHLLCVSVGECPNGNAKVAIIFNLAKDSRKNFKNSFLYPKADLSCVRAEASRERGQAMLSRIYPSPPGPNMAPSLRARPALFTKRSTKSFCSRPSLRQSSHTRKDACGRTGWISGRFAANHPHKYYTLPSTYASISFLQARPCSLYAALVASRAKIVGSSNSQDSKYLKNFSLSSAFFMMQ